MAFAASLLALAGCGAAPQQSGAFPPQQVTVVTLKNTDVALERELPGRVSARLVAEVRPQVGGIVRHVSFTEGSQVRANQVLYELDDAEYQVALRSAEAGQLRARAAADLARRAATRGAELVKQHMISVQDNDTLQGTLQQSEADLAAADAVLEHARINLGYARIKSPIAGRIGKSLVTQGALVVANQAQPLATVQQLDTVYVDVSQSSSELLQLRQELGAGDQSGGSRAVSLALEDGTAYPEAGRLQFSDVTVDEATGSFLLRVLVPNPKGLLLPGMYVRATLVAGIAKHALLAPQQGITRDPKGNATAMIVGAGNKVEMRSVTTSRAVGDQWLVVSGLAAGDRVIVEGLQKIAPGAPVVATERGAAPTPNVAAPAAP
jgi:membrane fusion protein (multidrug efflux system)